MVISGEGGGAGECPAFVALSVVGQNAATTDGDSNLCCLSRAREPAVDFLSAQHGGESAVDLL